MISDDLHHCKDSIIVLIDNILQNIVKPQDYNIIKLHLWSDGPNKQFKNKFIAAGLHWLESRFNVSIVWNFFATSHGKGPVDAIGGTVKRLVNNQIIQRVDHVNDVESFFNSLVKCDTKIKSFYISSNDINSVNEKDLQIIFTNASALNGIFTAHQIKNVNGHTEMRLYSQALYASGDQNSDTEYVHFSHSHVVTFSIDK